MEVRLDDARLQCSHVFAGRSHSELMTLVSAESGRCSYCDEVVVMGRESAERIANGSVLCCNVCANDVLVALNAIGAVHVLPALHASESEMYEAERKLRKYQAEQN